MVYKRSEYGLQFKVSSLVKNVPVYKEHVNYRHLRRERECAHTPISWDGELSESDDKLSPGEEVDKLPLSEMVITEEEEDNADNEPDENKDDTDEKTDDEDNVAKEKREAKLRDQEKQREVKETCDVEIVRANEALRRLAKEKLNKYSSKENTDQQAEGKGAPEKKVLGKTFAKPKVVDDKLFIKRTRPPRRPDRVGKLPCARPKSAPSSRPKSPGNELRGNEADAVQPFLNYGCGASNRLLGEKKTFNVRASTAVYPAALRAKKRNLLLIEKQQERQRSASAREKRRKAKFNERMIRETALWDTEYRRSYPCYENTEYKTSEREPRKQKSHFTT